jgi:hypothetical protein
LSRTVGTGDPRDDGVDRDRQEHGAVGPAAGQEHLETAVTSSVRALVEQDHPVTGAPQLLVQRLDQLGIERIGDVGDDDRDRPGPPGNEAAGRQIGRVAETLGHLQNAGRSGGIDARIAAQRP